jgi:FkbM family methyltransferase
MNTKKILDIYPVGYFVEAGAHDGVGDSTTYLLEQSGWSGICVEPSSAFYGLSLSRKCFIDNRALYISDNQTIDFFECLGNNVELSGIDNTFNDKWDRNSYEHKIKNVNTVTLPTLLEEHNAPKIINFLSLDTEGTELMILKHHNFNKYNFNYICIEHNGNIDKKNKTIDFLKDKNYKLIDSNSIDDWFEYCL